METCDLACDTVLTATDNELRAHLDTPAPQRRRRTSSRPLVRNGKIVKDDPQRLRAFFVEDIKRSGIAAAGLIEEKLQPRGPSRRGEFLDARE